MGGKKVDSAVYFLTNVMAFVGQMLTQRLHPKHCSGLKAITPFAISLAPK